LVGWLAAAWAVEDAPGALVAHPPLYRVDDPDFPGAIARSATGSVLEVPPVGVPWRREPEVRTDGEVGPVVWPAAQALDAMNVEGWHEAGRTGAGVHVAVFDVGWFGAGADPWVLGDVGSADCFAHPSCDVAMDVLRPFGGEDGDHGYACAAVVRSVAPDVSLSLVRVNGFTAFENAADWAIREGVDIVSMSLSFFNTSFYDGTGPFASVVRRLVAADILLVTSAGNSAKQHAATAWRDVDADGRLDFGGDNGLYLDLNGGGRRTVFVQWSEHGRCGDSDLDVYAYDPDGFLVGRAEAVQDPLGDGCDPVERLGVQAERSGVYRIEVVGRRVVASNLRVDVMAQAGQVVGGDPAASFADPANQPGALTVGAVRGAGYLEAPIESFSSQGPARSGVPKPDLGGPDGLDSPVFGADGFYGTSAATPAVAGAVALVLGAARGEGEAFTAARAAERLKAWAWRPSASSAWDDPRWGAGKVRLPELGGEAVGCARSSGGGEELSAGLLALCGLRARRRRDARP
jgi:subtilisin family serine protease